MAAAATRKQQSRVAVAVAAAEDGSNAHCDINNGDQKHAAKQLRKARVAPKDTNNSDSDQKSQAMIKRARVAAPNGKDGSSDIDDDDQKSASRRCNKRARVTPGNEKDTRSDDDNGDRKLPDAVLTNNQARGVSGNNMMNERNLTKDSFHSPVEEALYLNGETGAVPIVVLNHSRARGSIIETDDGSSRQVASSHLKTDQQSQPTMLLG
jgi:hypothetical protein